MATQGSLFVEELYQKIEMEMLINIGKTIGNGEDVTPDGYTNWRLEKLSQLGTLREEQLKVLAKYAGMTVKEMKKYIRDKGLAEVELFDKRNESLVKETVGYLPPTNTVYERLLALEKQATDVMNMVNTNMISHSEQMYVDIVTRASAEALTGNLTLQQAVTKAAREWAEIGVPCLTDKAGKKWSTESYINMVVRNTNKNVAVEMQEARMDEYDFDLLEISSHAGCRPSHLEYQGKVFSRSGKSKRYPALSSTTYGEIDGVITGINCAHLGYVYVEGKSTKRYEPYDKKESVEQYNQSQKQRTLERNIRKAKKERAMLDAMEVDPKEIERADKLIRQRQAKMREFIKETGRTRRRNREQVAKV